MAKAAATNNNAIELKNRDLLYLLEYSIIYKVGGVSSPYAGMEWHGIQIPEAISTMLNEIGLRFNFVTATGSYEERDLYFSDKNPAGRGLYFAENPDLEEDFVKYAVELQCLNPVKDIAQYQIPQLEEIAHEAAILLNAVTHTGTQHKRDLDASLRAAGTSTVWFPHPDAPCQKNLELNYHLGVDGVMSPGRIQDPEGAKHLVISYQTAAGGIAGIIRNKFPLVTYKDALNGKLKVDEKMTAGGL
jgi:hypothetical protein